MRNEYNKERIAINFWTVTSEDIGKLYDFFVRRFPKSNIEISLETHDGHKRIYMTFSEFKEDIPRIIANKQIISSIHIVERESKKNNNYKYKQIWVDISFGKFPSASMHVVGGDTDGTYKDWVEGVYTDLISLKKMFEITDENITKILEKDYKNIIFDPNHEIYDKIVNSLQNMHQDNKNIIIENKINLENINKITIKEKLISVLVALFVAFLVYIFGWN